MLTTYTQKISSTVSLLWHTVLDKVIAPPFCAYCKVFLQERAIFCLRCYQSICPVVSARIQINKAYTMTVLAVADYNEPLKSLVLAKASANIIASKQIGHLIWELTYFKHMPCDYVIPVPLHWRRYAKRGYNQAEEIARVLGAYKKIPIVGLVKRTSNTPFQSSIAIEERFSNVKSAFALDCTDVKKYENKHLVIVDDLMTTGSTLVSIAKELAPLKPASINAIVLCRACKK